MFGIDFIKKIKADSTVIVHYTLPYDTIYTRARKEIVCYTKLLQDHYFIFSFYIPIVFCNSN